MMPLSSHGLHTASAASFCCFHGEKEKRPPTPAEHLAVTCRRIEESYKEAARRLPLREMPELQSCVAAAGLCIGLAGDPVSNIILNAVALLIHDQQRRPSTSWGGYKHVPWSRSVLGLETFMAACFRYLSTAQARRYLSMASHDLALAISLVHHDRRFAFPGRLLPDGGRIKAALRAAAASAEHPAPDVLARTMAAQYPSAALAAVLAKLRRCSQQQPLTAHDVMEIRDLLARQWPPTTSSPPPVKMEFSCRPNGTTCARRDDGALLLSTYILGEEGEFVATVLIERRAMDQHQFSFIPDLTSGDMEAKLSACLQAAAPPPAVAVDYDASPCEHAVSLKLLLLDAVHAMYIKALAVMPKSPRLLRAVLVGGHCYGPMDPVSNIILNSAWYDMAFPPPKQGGKLPDGVGDTRPMSRVASRSLDGLVAMLRHCNLSEHEALDYLSSADCDLSGSGISNIPIASVAKAARHPQHAAFGSFLGSLSLLPPENGMQYLRNLLAAASDNGGIFSGAHWDQLTAILHSIIGMPVLSAQEEKKEASSSCRLSQPALSRMAEKKSGFLDKLTFVRNRLNTVLEEYCNKHPWEPSYQVDIVCGAWKSSPSSERQNVYHANFLVSTDAAAPNTERTLFFAEFWVPSENNSCPRTDPKDVEPKPSICCPVYDYRACNVVALFVRKKQSRSFIRHLGVIIPGILMAPPLTYTLTLCTSC
ncbi:unnamed protein product [Urochloa decumbens]|uniref:Uncharacterized protein n=1 Tax=Urochloa decumbens TaxID=240449 RepID=A0ABC8YYF8_9POAL